MRNATVLFNVAIVRKQPTHMILLFVSEIFQQQKMLKGRTKKAIKMKRLYIVKIVFFLSYYRL
jgi:hypothetical protein